MAADYTQEELNAIYELGKMYYELGYITPAERIFAGLVAIDEKFNIARIGTALVKIDRGQYSEAVEELKIAVQGPNYIFQAKLAMAVGFIAQGEFGRARILLGQVELECRRDTPENIALSDLREGLLLRCSLG